MRAFCTNKTIKISDGVYAVDAVHHATKHTHIINRYKYHTLSEEGSGSANEVVWDETSGKVIIRLKNDTEDLQKYIKMALVKNKKIRDEYLESGCLTSVLDINEKAIKIDCDDRGRQNITFLVDMIKLETDNDIEQITQYKIDFRDYYNEMHSLTGDQVIQMYKDLITEYMKSFHDKIEREIQIKKATSIEEIEMILSE